MSIEIKKLRAVKLKPNHYENTNWLEGTGLVMDHHYAVLGEYGDSGHYIILDVNTGTVMRGYFHIDGFEEIPEDEL